MTSSHHKPQSFSARLSPASLAAALSLVLIAHLPAVAWLPYLYLARVLERVGFGIHGSHFSVLGYSAYEGELSVV